MTPGMTIEATTPRGTIRIIAHQGYERTFEWDECSKTLRLRPRVRRFEGRNGIVFPGNGLTWLFGCGGIHNATAAEEQMPVEDKEQFYEFIRMYKGMQFVYRNDGLVVGWNRTRTLITFDVLQVLVQGKKPTQLEGAQDESIIVSYR